METTKGAQFIEDTKDRMIFYLDEDGDITSVVCPASLFQIPLAQSFGDQDPETTIQEAYAKLEAAVDEDRDEAIAYVIRDEDKFGMAALLP